MHAEALCCVYCLQIMDKEADAQRINKREVAHTACAFAADEALFFFLDLAQSEQQ